MSIKITASPIRRTTASRYNISQWTSKSNNLALYRNLASGNDPDMMKADNLIFRPQEMIGGTGITHQQSDRAYANLDIARVKPLYVTMGAFLVFLAVFRYLRS